MFASIKRVPLTEYGTSLTHGRQAHAIQMICSNLKGFRATIQIQVDSKDKQIKHDAI